MSFCSFFVEKENGTCSIYEILRRGVAQSRSKKSNRPITTRVAVTAQPVDSRSRSRRQCLDWRPGAEIGQFGEK